jgi:creatinine amidohydrolase
MHHDAAAVRTDQMASDAPQRVVNHDVVPIDTRMSTASGSLSSPMGASADIGKLLTQWLVERVVTVIDDEFPRASSARKGQ